MTGEVIRKLRQEQKLTQEQLANALHVSNKTVSKWERGLGIPDVSLLPAISAILHIGIEEILQGDLSLNEEVKGNMRKLQFFVCPHCGNVVTATGDASISCCGRNLTALVPEKPDEMHDLKVETIENEWYIETEHKMEKDHYISFIAIVTGDKVLLSKQYPEWDMHLRLPKIGRGILYYYCTNHGLFKKIP